jgi:polyphosphate kinase
VLEMLAAQAACYAEELLPALREHGIVLAAWNDLSEAQRAELGCHFDAHMSPALTPLGFDPTHRFPFISNLSTKLGIRAARSRLGRVRACRRALVYIGSADWMYRNLSRRVEAAAPVDNRQLRERLWEILDVNLRDHRQAWEMGSDGRYSKLRPSEDGSGPEAVGSNAWLMETARRRTGS